MENDVEQDNNYTKVKVSELIKKFRTKRNIYDFCRENSIYIFIIFRQILP